MTYTEAIAIVEQIRISVSGTGKDHDAAREAVSLLRDLATAAEQKPAEVGSARVADAPAGQG